MRQHLFLVQLIGILSLCDCGFCESTHQYKVNPASRRIDINEDEDYTVSIQDVDADFSHCYYESDTISGHYAMLAGSKNTWRRFNYNVIDTFEGTKICGFTLRKVNNNSPKKWIITAFDNKTQQNFTETITVSFYYNVPIFQKTISILPGASYFNYLKPTKVKLSKCSISFDNSTVELDINSNRADFLQTESEDSMLRYRLSSLGGSKCGLKVDKSTLNDPREFYIIAEDDDNNHYRAKFKLVVINKGAVLKNRTQEEYLGDSATVLCGKVDDTSINSDQQFCHLYNPKGELVSIGHMCEYGLEVVTVDDVGVWRCLIGYDFTMDSLEFRTELIEKKRESVQLWSQDINQLLVVGLKLNNYEVLQIKFCKFIRPDGRVFKIHTGAATERYTTLATDLENGVCAVEIMKPLREEEKGTWKLEAHIGGMLGITGGFVDVEKSSSLNYYKIAPKVVHLGDEITIECSIPRSADYCFILAPNTTQYRPKTPFATNLGLCSMEIEETTLSDNGTWTCVFASPHGQTDQKVTTEVSIIEMKVLFEDVEAALNEDVVLRCDTGGIPLEYCRFSTPLKQSYSLNIAEDNQRMSYSGRGLDFGDCGVRISKITYEDSGQWLCHISPGRGGYGRRGEITQPITLTVAVPVLAKVVGVSIAILVSIIVIAGAFALFRHRKRLRAGGTDENFVVKFENHGSSDSVNSGNPIIISSDSVSFRSKNEAHPRKSISYRKLKKSNKARSS